MKKEDLQKVIKLCHQYSIAIVADEVYQQNIYREGTEFVSVRKALHDLGEPYASSVELISCNSISKGMLGECGLRGGYFELHNLDQTATDLMFKLKCIELCGNTVGQASVGLMVDPPRLGRESKETCDLYWQEYSAVFDGLK